MSRFWIGIITIYDDCLAIRISRTFKILLCINDQSRTTDHTGKACDRVRIYQIAIYIGSIRFFGRRKLLIAIDQLLAECLEFGIIRCQLLLIADVALITA